MNQFGQPKQTQQQDYELPNPPNDTISALEFSPRSSSWNAICAGSWDNTVRIWEVQADRLVPKVMNSLEGTPFDLTWNDSGNKVYLSDSSGQVTEWDLESNQLRKVGLHARAARTCHWVGPYLATTSWDKSIRFWDPRAAIELTRMELPDRSYAADVLNDVAVVACGDRSILAYTLRGGPVEQGRMKSPGESNTQVRSVALHQNRDLTSWLIAKTNGMVFDQSMAHRTVSFPIRCHRRENSGILDVYAVNEVKVNMVTQHIATVGSDGVFCFWDSQMRSKLLESKVHPQPITKCAISGDGKLFAYALGYDWSKGHEYSDSSIKPHIFLRPFETNVAA
uniref:AT07829p n=1 Tax=Drosophila melanogaster TaxID=7227 RepID=Q8T4A6_DROME|nr:AT07829p [Drosophila melanogaster]